MPMSIPPSPLRPEGQQPLQIQRTSSVPRPPPPPRSESTQSTGKTTDPRKRPRASEDTESSIEDANRLIKSLRIDENAPERTLAASSSTQPTPSHPTTVVNVNVKVHQGAQPLSPAGMARPPTGPRALSSLNPPSSSSKPPAPQPKSKESKNAESPTCSLTSVKDTSWLPPPPPDPSHVSTTERVMDQVPPSPSTSEAASFALEKKIWHERIV